MFARASFLFGAAVALVILVDLATGQGPPIYTNYLQAQGYRTPQAPPSVPMPPSTGLYPQRVEFSSKKPDKELEKAIELGKVSDESQKESYPHAHEKKFEKELEKEHGKEHGKKEDYESTTAPSMLSSLSNTMSDAWNRFSTLGRSTRSVPSENKETKDKGAADKNKTGGSSDGTSKQSPSTSGRSIDSYEYLQNKQNGYIYFKVPKHLVCGY